MPNGSKTEAKSYHPSDKVVPPFGPCKLVVIEKLWYFSKHTTNAEVMSLARKRTRREDDLPNMLELHIQLCSTYKCERDITIEDTH